MRVFDRKMGQITLLGEINCIVLVNNLVTVVKLNKLRNLGVTGGLVMRTCATTCAGMYV